MSKYRNIREIDNVLQINVAVSDLIELLIVIIVNVEKHHTIMLLRKSIYCSYVNINVSAVKAVSIFCVQSRCTSQITKTNLLVA